MPVITLWFAAFFCVSVYVLYSVVCLIVIAANHQKEYLFYYSHHCRDPDPNEFILELRTGTHTKWTKFIERSEV